jgi:hypothetical protein
MRLSILRPFLTIPFANILHPPSSGWRKVHRPRESGFRALSSPRWHLAWSLREYTGVCKVCGFLDLRWWWLLVGKFPLSLTNVRIHYSGQKQPSHLRWNDEKLFCFLGPFCGRSMHCDYTIQALTAVAQSNIFIRLSTTTYIEPQPLASSTKRRHLQNSRRQLARFNIPTFRMRRNAISNSTSDSPVRVFRSRIFLHDTSANIQSCRIIYLNSLRQHFTSANYNKFTNHRQ